MVEAQASHSVNYSDLLSAWVIFTLGTPIRTLLNFRLTRLHGIGEISLPRFLDAVAWIIGGSVSAFVVWASGSVAASVVALHCILGVTLSLISRENPRLPRQLILPPMHSISRNDLHQFWAPAWRGGLGLLFNTGGRTLLAILVSGSASASEATVFLFAQNLFSFIAMLGVVPFSSRLQDLASAFQQGEMPRQFDLAKSLFRQSMVLTSASCVLGLFFFTSLSSLLPEDKNIDPFIWYLLSCSVLLQRFGASHLTHYSVTNHVVLHLVDGPTAVVMVLLAALVFPLTPFGVSISILLSNLLLYVPLALIFVFRRFGIQPLKDSVTSSVPAISAFLLLGFLAFLL